MQESQVLNPTSTLTSRIHRYPRFLKKPVYQFIKTTLRNMSDYGGGGDDEPMDYGMGECASPLRTLSQIYRG